jgi:hypothetical protein
MGGITIVEGAESVKLPADGGRQPPAWYTPLLLLALCIAAFGLLIPWLGFYQDDWYQMWFKRAFGPGVWISYYAIERPFIAGLYMLTTPLVGETPLNWQVFALVWRWLAALAAGWLAGVIWPGRRQLAWLVSLLFALYPGFREQAVAVIYSHYFIQITLVLLSLGWSVLAAQQPERSWRFHLPALVLAAAGILISEYFFGMEAARPLLIWLGLAGVGDRFRRLRSAARHAAPYLIILAAFMYWRLFIFQFPTYEPVTTLGGGWTVWANLARTALWDSIETGLLAWLLPLLSYGGVARLEPAALAAAALALAAFGGLAWLLLRMPAGDLSGERRAALGMGAAGLALVAAGAAPFWFVGLPLDTQIAVGSRFTIAVMFGAALLAAAGLLCLPPRLRAWLAAVLAGLAVGHHLQDANLFRQVHTRQAEFFQQLAWRAPGLRPQTLVLTNFPDQELFSGDNSLTAALNWVYDRQPPYRLEYLVFQLSDRLKSGSLPGLTPGLPIVKRFRTTQFESSTSQALVVFYDYPRCLRVLEPAVDGALPRPPELPAQMRAAVRLSNLAQIIADSQPPASLPGDVFRSIPPENTWCYYYEKAELARQQRQWAALAALADRALAGNPRIASAWEILPYIDGYLRTGQVNKAVRLTRQADEQRPHGRAYTRLLLCDAWRRGVDAAAGEALSAAAAQMWAELNCEN